MSRSFLASTPRLPRPGQPSLAAPRPASIPQCPQIVFDLSVTPSHFDFFVTSLLRGSIPIQNRDPLFSTACALVLFRNPAYPSCFVKPAHSLPKTPGGTPHLSSQNPIVPLTPIESKRSTRIAP